MPAIITLMPLLRHWLIRHYCHCHCHCYCHYYCWYWLIAGFRHFASHFANIIDFHTPLMIRPLAIITIAFMLLLPLCHYARYYVNISVIVTFQLTPLLLSLIRHYFLIGHYARLLSVFTAISYCQYCFLLAIVSCRFHFFIIIFITLLRLSLPSLMPFLISHYFLAPRHTPLLCCSCHYVISLIIALLLRHFRHIIIDHYYFHYFMPLLLFIIIIFDAIIYITYIDVVDYATRWHTLVISLFHISFHLFRHINIIDAATLIGYHYAITPAIDYLRHY